jgi:hypothetical protein
MPPKDLHRSRDASGRHSSANLTNRSKRPFQSRRDDGVRPEFTLTHRQKFPSEANPKRKEAVSVVSFGSERILAAARRRNHRRYFDGEGSPRRWKRFLIAPAERPKASPREVREEYRPGNSRIRRANPLSSDGGARPIISVRSEKTPSTHPESAAAIAIRRRRRRAESSMRFTARPSASQAASQLRRVGSLTARIGTPWLCSENSP